MVEAAKQQDKKKKKAEKDSFDEAYESILGYHKDYEYDENNGSYCCED